MPTSLGGGSSGGGFHGGGGGYHGGGSSGGSRGPRFSTHSSFPGARRYYYTNRLGRTCFFYFGGVPRRQSLFSSILMPVIFILVGILVGSLMIYGIVPTKISADKCIDIGVYYQDNIHVLDGDSELNDCLRSFYDSTGIQPYVYTMNYDDLPDEYGSMSVYSIEDFAMNLYLKTFDDEGHLLIVFARDPEKHSDWMWHVISGDDALVLVESYFTTFENNFQRQLLRDPENVATALTNTLNTASKDMMTLTKGDKGAIFFIILFMLVWVVSLSASIVSTCKRVKTINDYCSYRDGNGGVDTYEGANVSYTKFTPNSQKDDTDLFD